MAAESLYEGESHIRDCGAAVHPPLLLHCHDKLLNGGLFVFGKIQSLLYDRIAFHQFAGGEADRNPGLRGLFAYLGHHRVKAAVHCSAVVVFIAEVLKHRCLTVLRHVDGMVHKLVDALPLYRGDGNHRQAEDALHLVHADGSPVAAELVHHIEAEHHRQAEFHQLLSQVKVSLDVAGIHYIDYRLGLLTQDEGA